MRLPHLLALVVGLAGPVAPSVAESAETVTSSVRVVAEFASVTSLEVSTQTLQFVVSHPDQPAIAVVEFTAGARTRPGGEVLLSVEQLPMSAAASEPSVSFTGEGAGTFSGTLGGHRATPVAKWNGSGRRTGRLRFAIQAGAGVTTVPVRFVLSAP